MITNKEFGEWMSETIKEREEYFIKENKQKSHDIWEQRRYEIAKDILANLHSSQKTNYYNPNETVEVTEAVRMADLLIEELKKV